jgi:tetratricopeptide (TPR) repeat protein
MINIKKIAVYILMAIAVLILFMYLLKPRGEEEPEFAAEPAVTDIPIPEEERGLPLFSVDSLFEGTTEEYLSYLRTKEGDDDALLQLGHYYSDIGRYDLAVDYYLNSYATDSNNIAPLVYAAMAYSANAYIEKAGELFSRALSLQPDDPDVMLQAALFHSETGDFEKAEEGLRKVLEIDNENPIAAHHLSVSPMVTDMAERLELSRIAAVNATDEPLFLYNYAFVLHESGRVEESEERLKTMIEEYPSFIDSWLLLTAIYRDTGRPDDARNLLASALAHREVSDEYKFHLLELMNQIR